MSLTSMNREAIVGEGTDVHPLLGEVLIVFIFWSLLLSLSLFSISRPHLPFVVMTKEGEEPYTPP